MRARLAVFFLLACCLIAGATVVATAVRPTIGAVSYLTGDWRLIKPSGDGETRVVEKWSPAGKTMINVGYTVKGDSLLDYELVVIRERGAHLVYEAHPMGQEPALFTAITVLDTCIVFENLKHDFPQRVGYARLGKNQLLAWIEGPGKDGKMKRIEFPYESMK